MASVTFSPTGTQLDNDEIADLQVKVGDPLGFSFSLDTSGLDNELQSLKLRLEGDSTEINLIEVNLSDTLTDFFEATFSDVAVIEDNFDSIVVEFKGEPGAIPDMKNVLVEPEATVIDGLVNDGATDIGVTVLEAIDANGTDVTEKFVPSQQTVDLQPLPQVQQILGTEKSEPIIGTPQNDIIRGKEGNDLIIDSEGNDIDFGDEGNDVFLDDGGNDTIIGGAGDDFVNIDSDSGGDELIDLGTGNDFAFGGTGADTFVLNRDSGATGIGDFTLGEDRFALGENLTKDDLNFAQLDNDGLRSLNGSTLISDADGKLIAFVNSTAVEDVSNAEFISAEEVLPTDDYSSTTEESSLEPIQAELPEAQSGEIFGTPNPDVLVGDDGTNLILTGGDSSFVNAGGGDDLVFAEDNFNILNGEAGNDLLSGGVSEDALGDFLSGGEGADTLLGQRGNDILNGDDGNDLLVGGPGMMDAINGGKGDDLLFGGAGNDGLFGNEGQDTFAFASGEEADIIFDFEPGQDAIAFTTDFSYDSLQIEYNAEGNYTDISDETGELIATLIGVEADQLTESDFTVEGQTEVTIDADLDSDAEVAEPAIPLKDGITNLSFDTEFLASEAGLTFSEAEGTVEPTSEEFDLGFDITEESDFIFSEANGFTPLGGTIEHTGTVTFASGAGDVTVGDVSVSYDESRVSDTTSGLFVSNNVEGVIPEAAVLFDVGTFDGGILNIGKADLLIANEFADILQETGLASSDLTGADVGDIS